MIENIAFLSAPGAIRQGCADESATRAGNYAEILVSLFLYH